MGEAVELSYLDIVPAGTKTGNLGLTRVKNNATVTFAFCTCGVLHHAASSDADDGKAVKSGCEVCRSGILGMNLSHTRSLSQMSCPTGITLHTSPASRCPLALPHS